MAKQKAAADTTEQPTDAAATVPVDNSIPTNPELYQQAIEQGLAIVQTEGSKAAAAYAVKHGLSCEAAIIVVRGARHA